MGILKPAFAALALGAAAMAAAPAGAASLVDFSGYYRAYYMFEDNLGRQGGSGAINDSYLGHRLNLDFAFAPTDEISVYWRMRGPGFERWGRQRDMQMRTRHIYGLVRKEWGNVHIGRLAGGLDSYGLATLGYRPRTNPRFTNVSPFDNGNPIDAVRFSRRLDNGVYLMAQYAKLQAGYPEGGAMAEFDDPGESRMTRPKTNWDQDRDRDRYQAEAAFFWDGGGASLGAWLDRNAVPNSYYYRNGARDRLRAWFINPALSHSWGDFSLNFEGLFGWGRLKETYLAEWPNRAEFTETRERDMEGQAFYLDLDYNYGRGNVNLAGWWVSGSDLKESRTVDHTEWGYNYVSGTSNSLADMGANFYPLLVAYNGSGSGLGRLAIHNEARSTALYSHSNSNAVSLANNAGSLFIAPGLRGQPYLNGGGFFNKNIFTPGTTQLASFNNNTEANHWALSFSGNHALSSELSVHYALAYLSLNKPNYRVVKEAVIGAEEWQYRYATQEKDLGLELDVGFSAKLLDNLRFTSAFGYMWSGDAFKSLKGYNYFGARVFGEPQYNTGDRISAVWDDPKDTYVWYNTLTFSF